MILFFILNTTSTNKRKRNQNFKEKILTTENTIYFIKNEENILNFVEYKILLTYLLFVFEI
jgi:hypothetical protein